MREYLQISYYTLTGIRKLIDLGDFAYGEWIIYDRLNAKYYIDVFDKSSESNILINNLLTNKTETIESIIAKINKKQGTKLSLGKRPFIELVKNQEFVKLTLTSLPENWVKNI